MRLRRHLKLRTQWWLIVVITSLLVVLMTVDRTMERFDNGVYDHLLQLVPSPSSNAMLLVEIDDDSVRRIGRWPWNRTTHAALVDRLNAAGAKAIGYDVLFTEPTDARDDDALARAMAGGAPVFLPVLPSSIMGESDLGVSIPPIEVFRRAADGIGSADRRQHAVAPFGAPGCFGRVSTDASQFLFGAANAAVWNFGIPNAAGLLGVQMYNQALVLDPTWNALGGVLSDAAGLILGT